MEAGTGEERRRRFLEPAGTGLAGCLTDRGRRARRGGRSGRGAAVEACSGPGGLPDSAPGAGDGRGAAAGTCPGPGGPPDVAPGTGTAAAAGEGASDRGVDAAPAAAGTGSGAGGGAVTGGWGWTGWGFCSVTTADSLPCCFFRQDTALLYHIRPAGTTGEILGAGSPPGSTACFSGRNREPCTHQPPKSQEAAPSAATPGPTGNSSVRLCVAAPGTASKSRYRCRKNPKGYPQPGPPGLRRRRCRQPSRRA